MVYGEICIQHADNVFNTDVSKQGELTMLHMSYASSNVASTPKEAVLGIHTTNPTACVHIRGASMTPFTINFSSNFTLPSTV